MTSGWTEKAVETGQPPVPVDDLPISEITSESYPQEYRFLEEYHTDRPEFVKLVGSQLLFYLFALNVEAERSVDLDAQIRRGLDLIEAGYAGSVAVLAATLYADAVDRHGEEDRWVAEMMGVAADSIRNARSRLARWEA